MAIVVRLAPLPLHYRRAPRVAELERIFGTDVLLIEVVTMAELISAVAMPGVIAVALDAPPPGQLAEAVAAVGSKPVLSASLQNYVRVRATVPAWFATAVRLRRTRTYFRRSALRPLWRPRRNTRGEIDEVFDGYGLLTDAGIARLVDGELTTG